MLRHMNTTKKGRVRTIVFKEGNTWYGVALEFNIVVEGDEYEVVHFDLQEAIKGYVESLKKIKGARTDAPYALNQLAAQEYETMWHNLQSKKPIPSPIQIKYFGVMCV